jgi:hypothetical protein
VLRKRKWEATQKNKKNEENNFYFVREKTANSSFFRKFMLFGAVKLVHKLLEHLFTPEIGILFLHMSPSYF